MKANLGWPAVFGLLNVAYYVLHYMFASQVRLGTTCCGPRGALLQGLLSSWPSCRFPHAAQLPPLRCSPLQPLAVILDAVTALSTPCRPRTWAPSTPLSLR